MKNPPFEYRRPGTVEEALELLAEHGDDAKVLAGGQSLLPMMGLRLARPAVVVDIGGIAGLDVLEAGEEGATVGALVRHSTAERSGALARYAPPVHQALPQIGHRAIRTRGTVCGSIVHADPAAELPAVCLATEATVVARSRDGQREIDAADLFAGYLTTTVAAEELVTEVRFPPWRDTAGSAVVEVSRRHGDYAVVGVVCVLDLVGSTIDRAALAFLGLDSTPIRVARAEGALLGQTPGADLFAEAAAVVRTEVSPGSDLHATAAYRRHLAGVLTEDALAAAHDQIGVSA